MRIIESERDLAGGLLGYNKNGLAYVYNPSSGKYSDYFWYDAPPPALKFTEALEVVSFFRLQSREYYQSTDSPGWGNNPGMLIFMLLFLTGAYFCLYGIAVDYIEFNGMANRVTHTFIAARFRQTTGISVLKAALIFLSVTSVVIIWSAVKASSIRNRYANLYGAEMLELRRELSGKVKPGDRLTGLIINGYQFIQSESGKVNGDGEPVQEKHNSAGYSYVVEFTGIIKIPVYLRVNSNKAVLNIDNNLRNGVKTDFPAEYRFKVNFDYSVSFD